MAQINYFGAAPVYVDTYYKCGRCYDEESDADQSTYKYIFTKKKKQNTYEIYDEDEHYEYSTNNALRILHNVWDKPQNEINSNNIQMLLNIVHEANKYGEKTATTRGLREVYLSPYTILINASLTTPIDVGYNLRNEREITISCGVKQSDYAKCRKLASKAKLTEPIKKGQRYSYIYEGYLFEFAITNRTVIKFESYRGPQKQLLNAKEEKEESDSQKGKRWSIEDDNTLWSSRDCAIKKLAAHLRRSDCGIMRRLENLRDPESKPHLRLVQFYGQTIGKRNISCCSPHHTSSGSKVIDHEDFDVVADFCVLNNRDCSVSSLAIHLNAQTRVIRDRLCVLMDCNNDARIRLNKYMNSSTGATTKSNHNNKRKRVSSDDDEKKPNAKKRKKDTK